MTQMEGFAAYDSQSILGLVTYLFRDRLCEIMSLGKSQHRQRPFGVGGKAREKGVRCLTLITTNDNLRALGFYQWLGFGITALHRNAPDAARRLKPEIPLVGDNGILLRHEIEMEKAL